jgi:hypothetical protein
MQYASRPMQQFSNLKKMTHISASNPQLDNKRNSRTTPPASNNITPAPTPAATPFLNKNVSVFNFPTVPFEDAPSQNEQSGLRKSLSRHVSENNIYQVLKVSFLYSINFIIFT